MWRRRKFIIGMWTSTVGGRNICKSPEWTQDRPSWAMWGEEKGGEKREREIMGSSQEVKGMKKKGRVTKVSGLYREDLWVESPWSGEFRVKGRVY